MQVGDIVIIKEENLPRNLWPLAKVVETTVDKDLKVRKVRLLLADPHLDKHGKRVNLPRYLERPIHKLVVLVKNNAE